MRPREFLDLATELSRQAADAPQRTAISRAYYAAFHEARDLLASLGFAIRQSDQAHTAITRRLAQSGLPMLEQIGVRLLELKRSRNLADYELGRSLESGRVSRDIKAATEVFQIVKTEISPTERDEAIQNMRDYERDVLREVTWRERKAK